MSKQPTYILQKKQRNLIVGTTLLEPVTKAKVDRWRLGYETSEDALSWNVFMGLCALGGLGEAFAKMTGLTPVGAPELYLWGTRVDAECAPWIELQHVQSSLEPGMSIQTEPDIMLRVPGQAIVLIEAKFGSPNGTLKSKEKRFGTVGDFLKRYKGKPGAPDPLDRAWIKAQPAQKILEQLCRNAVFAQWLAAKGEQPFVINLVRCEAVNDEALFRRHLSADSICFCCRTWEDVHSLSIIQSKQAAILREYLQNKTLNLSRAFDF